MRRWPLPYQRIAIKQFQRKTYAEIAAIIGKTPEQVGGFLNRRRYLKRPQWNEMEILIIQNTNTKFAHELLPYRSKTAIRVKKHRLCTHAK